MADKNTENNTKKRRGNPQNLVMPWKPGQSGNPKGRGLGVRNRRTVIMDAIKRLGEANGVDPAEIEDALQAIGIQKAFKGSFFHFEAISDGLYGKMTDKMDLTSGGRTLADVITRANGKAKPGGKATATNLG